MPLPQSVASLGERLGDVSGSVVAHHPPALVAFGFCVAVLLAVEPGDSTAEKTDPSWLLLVCQDLDVDQPCRVVDGDMDLVVADPGSVAVLAIAGDAVAHLPEPGQLPLLWRSLQLDVDKDHVPRLLPRVPLHGWFGLQSPQTAQSRTVEDPGDGGERSLQQPGDVAEVQMLVADVDGALRRLLIKSAAGCGARCVDLPQRLHHLSGTAPANGERNGG